MSSTTEQDVSAISRSPKSIKYNIQLNDEQKAAKATILENTITLVTGKAGSGKTATVVQTALDQLFKKNYKRIIITRPLVTAGEELGILPGDIDDKLGPYLRPVTDMVTSVYNHAKVSELMKEGKIEIIPFGLMRGLNLDDAFIIADEIQNTTYTQLKLLMTRLTKNSKLVLCGDIDQIDLVNEKLSGFHMLQKLEGVPGYGKVVLLHNHRHEIVDYILDALAA